MKVSLFYSNKHNSTVEGSAFVPGVHCLLAKYQDNVSIPRNTRVSKMLKLVTHNVTLEAACLPQK